MENSENNKALIDIIAGAIAGCISRFAIGPLDVIKIRFQVQLEPIGAYFHGISTSKYTSLAQAFKTIYKEEGITALWRGTVPGQLFTVPYTAVQFSTLRQCKRAAKKMGYQDVNSSALVSFLSGGVAGLMATVASYPFDLLRTTLAAQGEPKVYNGMIDATKKIMAEKGVRGMYKGIGVTIIEIIPYSAIQFTAYDQLNLLFDNILMKRSDSKTSRHSLQTFLCGLMSGKLFKEPNIVLSLSNTGVFSKLCTHPLDVVKKRYQVAGLQRSVKYGKRVDAQSVRSILVCFRTIVKNEGMRGLWKGCAPNIAKAGPAAAITFLSYEMISGYLLSVI